MNSLVSLLIAAALVSLQGSSEAYPQRNNNQEIDNSLEPNELPATTNSKRRIKTPNVKIINPPPETIRITPGSTFVIECEAMGNPPPVIGWMKNGAIVSDFEEDNNEILSTRQISVASVVNKLVVRSAANGDIFTCVAISGVMETSTITTVYTDEGEPDSIVPQSIFPGTPIITAFYNDLLQTMGTSVTLPCRVYSPIPAQRYWLDNNNQLVYGDSRMRVLPSGGLHISNLVADDMGGYNCSVKNIYGEDSLATFLYPLKPSKE